jgi:hypothetical protein
VRAKKLRFFALLLVSAVLAGPGCGPAMALTGPPPPQGPAVADGDTAGTEYGVQVDNGTSLFVDPFWSGSSFGPCRRVSFTAVPGAPVSADGSVNQYLPLTLVTEWYEDRADSLPGVSMSICCRPQTITLCAGTTAATTYQLPYTILAGQVTQSASCPAGQAGETYTDSQTWTCGATSAADPNNDDGVWNEGETDGCAAVANASVGPPPACTVTCNSGFTWNGSACVADSGCGAGVASWGAGCSATYGAMNNGDIAGLVNSAGGYSGSETLSCNAGVVTPSSQVCNLAGCPAGSTTWPGPGGTTCAGSYAALNLNGSTPVPNSTAGLSGSETANCVADGSVSFTNPSCTVTGCPAGTLSWTGTAGAGSPCSGPYAGMDVGGSTTDVNTVAGLTGSASLGCLGPNDPAITSSSCAAGCSGGSTTWLTNCGGNYGVIAAGQMAVIFNTLNAAYAGSETASCAANGTVSFSNPSCTQIACPAGTDSWGGGCTGSYGLLSPGGSTPVPNTAGGYNGSETANCPASFVVNFTNRSCTPTNCAGQAESWSVGDLTCAGATGDTANGNSSTATNTTANQTGSASYSCSLGSWSGPSSSSCACASGYSDNAGSTSCVQDAYSWETGTCGGNVCPSQTGTRTVSCEDTYTGGTVDNSNCTGTAPSTSCTVSVQCPVNGVCGVGIAGCQTPYPYTNFYGCTGSVGNEDCSATWNCLGSARQTNESPQCNFSAPYQCGGNVPIGGCSNTP